MNRKPFLTQQESLVPEHLKPLVRDPKVKRPRKRGRKKSLINLGYFLFHRKLRLLGRKKNLTRQQLLCGLGIRKRVNFFSPPWHRMTLKEVAENQRFRHALEKKVNKDRRVVTVPVLTQEEIFARDDAWKSVVKREKFFVPANLTYGDFFFYFGMIMPDNCMLHDGICKGDRIAAVSNLRPGQGDMVVCRIPGTRHITVRRFEFTASNLFHTLYEGGTINPMMIREEDDLIYGVVVDVQRSYAPHRLPEKRPENLLPLLRGIRPDDPGKGTAKHTVSELYQFDDERNADLQQAVADGCVDWETFHKFTSIARVYLIKADKWPPRTPVFKRKGKKRGPKKHLRLKIASFKQRKAELAEACKKFKEEMKEYES